MPSASADPPPELAYIDDAIRTTFLIKPYAGDTTAILAQYQRDASEARKYQSELQRFASSCTSHDWTASAVAQEGMLFDLLATRLDDARNLPEGSYFTWKQKALILQLETSGREDLRKQAEDLRAAVKNGWRKKLDAEVAASVEVALRQYAAAVDIARSYGLESVDVNHARTRMADYTLKLGEETVRRYVVGANPTDPAGVLPK